MISISKLRQLRKSKGYSQEELADLLCISQSAASIENGKSKSVFNYIAKIGVIFNISPTELLETSELNENRMLFDQLKEKNMLIELLQNRIANLETTINLLQEITIPS